MKEKIREGRLRLMTIGEIYMARQVYVDSIIYSRVWIHCDSYFPFGFQSQDYAMAPNGELWYRESMYREDFSAVTVFIEDKHRFIHELCHVWQHQHGQWVRLRGLFSWTAEYSYTLDKERLSNYSLEQQASILADYWLLMVYGYDTWSYHQMPGRTGNYRGCDKSDDIPALYRKILAGSEIRH